jgi:hypothetical protein
MDSPPPPRPKPLLNRKPAGKIWLDRRKPFELFLKTGGGVFLLHCQVWRLSVTFEPNRKKRARKHADRNAAG